MIHIIDSIREYISFFKPVTREEFRKFLKCMDDENKINFYNFMTSRIYFGKLIIFPASLIFLFIELIFFTVSPLTIIILLYALFVIKFGKRLTYHYITKIL